MTNAFYWIFYRKMLRGHLQRAQKAVGEFKDQPEAQAYLQELEKMASKSYIRELQSSGQSIDKDKIAHIAANVKLIEQAASRNDLSAALNYSRAVLSVLPGNPTIPLPPPDESGTEKVKL